jgi:hypothetical protein
MIGLQSRLVSPGCATGTEARYQPGLMTSFALVDERHGNPNRALGLLGVEGVRRPI